MKGSFYEELEHILNKFHKYHTEMLLGDFNAQIDREDIFKPTMWNESLHKISNDN
jgi:exonuclease III